MSRMNNQVLELVRDELEAQCQLLVDIATEWREGRDISGLEKLRKVVSELRGIASMLVMSGSSTGLGMLADFLEKTDVSDDKATILACDSSIALAQYLSFSLQRGEDNPLLILPELNKLKEATRQTLLTESDLLSDQLGDLPFVKELSSYSAENRLIIRRARHMYQQGLLHAIKGSSKAGAFRILGHAVRRVQQIAATDKESDYWLVVLQLLDAFSRRTLRLNKGRLRNLMAIERQMRGLMAEQATQHSAYPDDLQRQVFTLFLLAGFHSPQAVKLATRLELTPFVFTDQNLAADYSLFGSEGVSSFADTMTVLRDEKDSMSLSLERLEKREFFDDTDREGLFNNLLAIAEVSSVSGLAKASSRFSEHAEELKSLSEQEAVPDTLIRNMVDSSLYLECLLLEINNQIPGEQRLEELNNLTIEALVEANITRHAGVVVLEESRKQLNEVMGRVSQMQQGLSEPLSDEDLQDPFRLVSGAAEMLGLNKASQIAERCLQFFNGQDLATLTDDKTRMSLLADVIVSLEYYFDNCRWDRQFDAEVLTIANESLDELSS